MLACPLAQTVGAPITPSRRKATLRAVRWEFDHSRMAIAGSSSFVPQVCRGSGKTRAERLADYRQHRDEGREHSGRQKVEGRK